MIFDTDNHYLQQALAQAKTALEEEEIPVGAVVVLQDRIVGRGYNRRETLNDPTAHAEILAITAAANSIGDWRLTGCTLYVTKEPCPMCAGAVVNARIQRLVFGAWDEKAGCAGSLYQLCRDPRFNHQLDVKGGIMEEECSALLKTHFQRQRDK